MAIKYIPYTYLIGWSKFDLWYYGSQYGKHANPINLWKTYFTSSKEIKKLIKQYGKESFHVEVRKVFTTAKVAKLWENKVLQKLKVLKREDWLNANIGGHWEKGHNGKTHSEETKRKMSLTRKGALPWNKGVPMTIEQKEKIIKTRKNKGIKVELFLPKLIGDKNPMRNPEILEKYKKQITGRRRKYREDGSWYWYKE